MKRILTYLLICAWLLTGCSLSQSIPTDSPEEEPTSGISLWEPTVPQGQDTKPSGPAAPSDPSVPSSPDRPDEPENPTDPIVPEPEPDLDPVPDTQTGPDVYTMLFDIHNKVSIILDMTDSELAKMQADYEAFDQNGSKSPIYRKGNLCITIETPDGTTHSYTMCEVGVRMKGNTSRTAFYSREEGIYNLIHLKLSFDETFDDEALYGTEAKQWEENARKERKQRTFAGLDKLDLRWNKCDDGTYLKEYYAYETFRRNGVPAPHTNLCSFRWAGIHMGVFTLNEPVDENMLARQLPQEALGGDLYKVGWAGSGNGSFTGTNSIGIENELEGKFYAYDLKTNKKTSQHEQLKKLIVELNSGSTGKDELAQLLDLDRYLSFCAVSYLLGNPDDMRNNYNNFYLYFRADNGKAIFIPYDFDRCLGITAEWNPSGDGMTRDNPFATYRWNNSNETQASPLILLTVASGGHYVKEFADALSQAAGNEWFTAKEMKAVYSVAESLYGDLTKPGKSFRNGEGKHFSFDFDRTSDFSSQGNISLSQYLDAKLATLKTYLSKVDDYTQGTPSVGASWYIRADFTNWQTDYRYELSEEDGLYSIRLDLKNTSRLKVYNQKTENWFGSECVPEDWDLEFTTDKHTNIVLEPGIYRIVFDPVDEIIYLYQEG